MTAKPDKTGPRNSSLVGGKLKSRPANPLPHGLGVSWLFALWGVGGGVRSVPVIVDSVVGRRPNTGVRLGRLINQNSHAIRVPELSAAPENVAIPTMQFQRLTYVPGNCMRHF